MSFNNVIALCWVLAAALPTFWLIQPAMEKAMGREVYRFRRSMWLGVTVVVFLSPSFWVYAAVLIVLLLASRKRERNPVALFLVLLLAAPIGEAQLPKLGSMALISVNHIILLTVCLLLPALFSPEKDRTVRGRKTDSTITPWVILFCAVQIVLWSHVESSTHSLRRAVTFLLSTVLLYLGCARLLRDRDQLLDAVHGLLMGLAVLASVAIVEAGKHWLLYAHTAVNWGLSASVGYLARGDSLRVAASTESPIMLGQFMVCGIVLALFVHDRLEARERPRIRVLLGMLLVALFVTYSRSPWITAMIGAGTYLLLSPKGGLRALNFAGLLVAAACLALLTPYGSKIIDFLPYVGTVDSFNVSYRQSMSATLWAMMWRSPLTGNPNLWAELEQYRQGQGIIDPLNVYLSFGASFGLPGLLSFAACLLLACSSLLAKLRRAKLARDRTSQHLAAALLAMLVSHMVLLYVMSYVTTAAALIWILVALATSKAARQAPQAIPSTV